MDRKIVLLIIVSIAFVVTAIGCDSMPTPAPVAAPPPAELPSSGPPYWEMTPTSDQAALRDVAKGIAQNCFQNQGKLLVPESKGCSVVSVKEMVLSPSVDKTVGVGPPYVGWLVLGQATIGNKTRSFAWQANFTNENGTGFKLTDPVFAWTSE